MSFLQSIRLGGFLSFPPDSPPIELRPLNVLIGPNGSGKSNLLEAIELLRAAPVGLASFFRQGSGAEEWIWKGEPKAACASVDVAVSGSVLPIPGAPEYRYRYRLGFLPAGQQMVFFEETLDDFENGQDPPRSYYRMEDLPPVIHVRQFVPGSEHGDYVPRRLKDSDIDLHESVLSQFRDPQSYPVITWLSGEFADIRTFRNWAFGRTAPLRRPQATDLPIDALSDDAGNLALVLNELQISNKNAEFNRLLSRFLPRYDRFSTRIYGNTVQFYLHEKDFGTPIPATRISDGTIRFMAILAVLLSPSPPPLVTIEEPELGLHPDAVNLLAEVLVDASSRMQVILTTHSDALVSALSEVADSVLVCENLHGTTFERIDPEKLKFWLDRYRLGEIWRIGEIGGNP